MIYLDNSATTKPSAHAAEAAGRMLELFGNPSSLHGLGVASEEQITLARNKVANAIAARNDEIYFTSGGTEANNLAVLGAAEARRKRGNRIVVTSVEHDSVMQSAKHLSEQGFDVRFITPDSDGHITSDMIAAEVDASTILVSCMLVNNETGVIFPVETIRGIVERAKAPALIHVDAVQALGKLKLDVTRIDCDLLTISAHKIHGIKGAGALFMRKGVTIRSRTFGGHQEKGVRPGTEPAYAIAAFGAACEDLDVIGQAEHMQQLNTAFRNAILSVDGTIINSPLDAANHIINFSLPGYRSETLLHALEQRKIYVSSGSACKKGAASHVLAAQGLSRARTDSAIRVSLDNTNTVQEANAFAEALREIAATTANTNKRR